MTLYLEQLKNLYSIETGTRITDLLSAEFYLKTFNLTAFLFHFAVIFHVAFSVVSQ